MIIRESPYEVGLKHFVDNVCIQDRLPSYDWSENSDWRPTWTHCRWKWLYKARRVSSWTKRCSARNSVEILLWESSVQCQEEENPRRAHPWLGLGWCHPVLVRFSGELGWVGVSWGEPGSPRNASPTSQQTAKKCSGMCYSSLARSFTFLRIRLTWKSFLFQQKKSCYMSAFTL